MTIGVASLAPWQHSSPTGGMVSTLFTPAGDLRPGMVVRTGSTPMWKAITTLETRIGVGLVATLDNEERLWVGTWTGLEVRQDLRFEPAPIAACGCWDTSYLDHGGIWTCDTHRRAAA